MTYQVRLWRELHAHYRGGGLILGNGTSRAFDARFSYESLYEAAREQGHLDEEVRSVFEALETQDFEQVLRDLGTSARVINALGGEATRLNDAYAIVRDALISTVRHVHPNHAQVADQLPAAAAFMRNFRTVASLNYDVLVYWAMLRGNSTSGARHLFKDAFHAGGFDVNWQRFREPLNGEDVTLVCYPHGHLAMIRDQHTVCRKLRGDGATPLLESIAQNWEMGVSPVFVSEGTTAMKLSTIACNTYLSVVQKQILPDLPVHAAVDGAAAARRTVVFLGWRVQEQDVHILQALGEPVDSLAVGVNPRDERLAHEQRRLEALIRQHCEVRSPFDWFDYQSPGCWIVEE